MLLFGLGMLFCAFAVRIYSARLLYRRRFPERVRPQPPWIPRRSAAVIPERVDEEQCAVTQLRSLPVSTWTSEAALLALGCVGSTGGKCTICFEAYKPGDAIRFLRCGHVYHQHCLDPWLFRVQRGRSRSCPLCGRDPLGDGAHDGSARESHATVGAPPAEALTGTAPADSAHS